MYAVMMQDVGESGRKCTYMSSRESFGFSLVTPFEVMMIYKIPVLVYYFLVISITQASRYIYQMLVISHT